MDKSLTWPEIAATKLSSLIPSASPGSLVYSFNTRDGDPVMSGVAHIWRVDLAKAPTPHEKPQIILSFFVPDKGNKSAMSFSVDPSQVMKIFGMLPGTELFYFIID